MKTQDGDKNDEGAVAAEAGAETQPVEEGRGRGFWRRVVDSWCVLPVLHMVLFWGGCATVMPLTHSLEKAGFVSDQAWGVAFGICGLLGMVTAACLPLLVVVQLFRRQWKTALATALLSAAVLFPFLWLLWKMSDLRHLC